MLWLPCGAFVEAYANAEFNACLDCARKLLGDISSKHLFQTAFPDRGNQTGAEKPNSADTKDPAGVMTLEQVQVVSGATVRAGLCDPEDEPLLNEILSRAKVPKALADAAVPGRMLWDHSITGEERRSLHEAFTAEQNLWRVLLKESGLILPEAWQVQPLPLVSCLALLTGDTGYSGIALFAQRLDHLRTAEINNSVMLVKMLQKAGDVLYKELSTHTNSPTWYNTEEPRLADAIVERLLSLSSGALQTSLSAVGGDSLLHTNQLQSLKKRVTAAFHDEQSPANVKRRADWKLPVDCKMQTPPHKEVPRDFLYRASLAGSLYITLDLKSADFHVLRLAVPQLLQAASWKEWVEQTLAHAEEGDLLVKVPFLGDLKPLRVRVLGKTLHKKNAALQTHCLRLLTRVLVAMADDGSNHTEFACVERVFRFSCDELCMKLSLAATWEEAHRLSTLVERTIGLLGWESHLPVRVEVFRLDREVLGDRIDSMQVKGGPQIASSDETDGYGTVTHLYPGHPSLRTSKQFVDLPALHDPAWMEPFYGALPHDERCADSYFVRQQREDSMDTDEVCDGEGVQFKKLPCWARPIVVLERMRWKIQLRITRLEEMMTANNLSGLNFGAAEYLPPPTGEDYGSNTSSYSQDDAYEPDYGDLTYQSSGGFNISAAEYVPSHLAGEFRPNTSSYAQAADGQDEDSDLASYYGEYYYKL
jgi:hypothetical protein